MPAEQTKHYEAELEINDFPQHSRWKVSVSLQDVHVFACLFTRV
jgi:hypothetical protein